MEPVPPAVEVQSLNHWTAREVPGMGILESLVELGCYLLQTRILSFYQINNC